MSKPLALPVVPIVRHPTRPAVVWAVGSCVFFYDLQQKTLVRPLGDSSSALRALDARHDAQRGTLTWLTAGDEKLLTTWLEPEAGGQWQQQEQLSCQKKLTAAIFDGDGRIVFADRFGDVCRWSGDGEPELLSSHFAIVTALALSPCQRFLVVGDNHERVRVSCYPEAAEIRSFCFGHLLQITAVACEKDGLLSASADGTLRLWNLDGEEQKCWTLGAPISCLSYENGTAVLGLEAPQAQVVQLKVETSQVDKLISEAPQAVKMQPDGSLLWVDRRGHLHVPDAGGWSEVSPGEDLAPALVILSKNAGDADDAEEEGDAPKDQKSSKKKRRE